jgi:CubicO group peptidase (beta-lactamase class C family)
MTKLMTAMAILQRVDAGIVTPDTDVVKYLASIGKYGVLTAFNEEENEATTVPSNRSITLRAIFDPSSPLGNYQVQHASESYQRP